MNKFMIKNGYKIRPKNAPFPDVQPTGTVYQPYVYELAIYLLKTAKLKYVIDIGAGNGEKLKGIESDFRVIAIDCDTNIELLKKNLPESKIINYDLEKGLPQIDEKILKQSVVISADVIEHIRNPHKYIKGLSKFSQHAPYVLVSTPDRTRARGAEDYGPPNNPFHVREWTIDELYGLFKKYKMPCTIGFTVSNDDENYKGTILAVSGSEINFKNQEHDKTVLAIMTAYNEDDIIESSVNHLLSQNIDVHIVDNWSTDKTFSIVKKMSKNNNRVTCERWPKTKPTKHTYKWTELLKKIEEIAEKSKHEWIIHNDADEQRNSPWKNISLQHAISFVDNIGYNSIDFTVIDFRPTKNGYNNKKIPSEFFHDFEFTSMPSSFMQIKCWKNICKVDLVSTGGHHARFDGQKLYPIKFLSKHYSLRSEEQAKKKIFKERKNTFDKTERAKGWHVQYDHFTPNQKLLWDRRQLIQYTEGHFNNEFLVERISGIGIPRD